MNEFNPLFKPGILQVICGPMKSGKTLELIHLADKLSYMTNVNYEFFKPAIDTRQEGIASRKGAKHVATIVKNSLEILQHINGLKVVFIDEAHFFDSKIVFVVKELLNKNIHVIVSGLDTDFRREPFGSMPELLALAQEVKKLHAVCDYKNCNNPAYSTQRLVNGQPARYDDPIILVGDAKEGYETRCRKHHKVKH